ncbi:transposase [Nostoc sp. LEGE 12447]|uniref:transposase n=1 Tax=Nostoc sp. LEGE 12447 TaxID=1828640 RepID=UPI001D15DBA9|nr:transposase [Nostoc sp. LEGE 12447]
MPYSSSLSDKEWEIIEPLLPQKKKTRPPRWTKRQILDGVFYHQYPLAIYQPWFRRFFTFVIPLVVCQGNFAK